MDFLPQGIFIPSSTTLHKLAFVHIWFT